MPLSLAFHLKMVFFLMLQIIIGVTAIAVTEIAQEEHGRSEDTQAVGTYGITGAWNFCGVRMRNRRLSTAAGAVPWIRYRSVPGSKCSGERRKSRGSASSATGTIQTHGMSHPMKGSSDEKGEYNTPHILCMYIACVP